MSEPTGVIWTDGPERWTGAPVLISVTDFLIPRAPDRARAFAAVLGMRRLCTKTPGALGLWLWAMPLRRRSGAVSAWAGEAELRAFVSHPDHLAIMRRFRDRGEVTSATWWTDAFDRDEAWRTAKARLGGDDPELAHRRPS